VTEQAGDGGRCGACGAHLSAGEPHRVEAGQHDVTGTLSLELPPLEGLVGRGE